MLKNVQRAVHGHHIGGSASMSVDSKLQQELLTWLGPSVVSHGECITILSTRGSRGKKPTFFFWAMAERSFSLLLRGACWTISWEPSAGGAGDKSGDEAGQLGLSLGSRRQAAPATSLEMKPDNFTTFPQVGGLKPPPSLLDPPLVLQSFEGKKPAFVWSNGEAKLLFSLLLRGTCWTISWEPSAGGAGDKSGDEARQLHNISASRGA
jgi:hypothetical protein